MPLYGYACRACGHEVEEIGSLADREKLLAERARGRNDVQLAKAGLLPLCEKCQCVMETRPGASNINFRTWGGNTYGFSSNRPPKGNRKPVTIGRGHGLGGRRGRKPPTKRDFDPSGSPGKSYA